MRAAIRAASRAVAAFASTSNQGEDETNDIERLEEEVKEIKAKKDAVTFTFSFTWFKEKRQGEDVGKTSSKTDPNIDCCAYRGEGDEDLLSTFSTARL